MPNPPSSPVSLDRISGSVLLGWMSQAALFGLFVGTVAGIVALRAG